MKKVPNARLPFRFERPPRRQLWRGLMISALGWIVCFYGMWGLIMVLVIGANAILVWPLLLLTGLLEPQSLPVQFSYVFLFALPSVVVPLFGPELLERGRRMRAKDAISVLAKDHRAPVVYLRSFEDEDLVDPTLPSLLSMFILRFRPHFVRNRYEATLTQSLRRQGPVITVGRPGETYPEIGAARLYVPHSDWQKAVRYFLSRAAAVVFAVGRTQSLWWEINTALATLPLERILFLFPYADKPQFRRSLWRKYWAFLGLGLLPKKMLSRMENERQERYQVFRKRARSLLPMDLPQDLGTSLFLDFSREGSPRLLETKRPFEKTVLWSFFKISWTQVNLRRTLRPFLEKLQK